MMSLIGIYLLKGDKMKQYDVIIIGGGPAGLSCSICLARNGISSLIIDKSSDLMGKVCGDALTVDAITMLDQIGIDPLTINGRKVYSKIIYKNETKSEQKFVDMFGHEFEYGVSHDLLIQSILNHALRCGVTIEWNHECRNICFKSDGYYVDNAYIAREIILANGAEGMIITGEKLPSDMPLGMSAQIQGNCSYSNQSFHYFYDECYGNGYAWLFPIGNNTWNIGVYRCARKNLSRLYYEFEKKVFAGNTELKYLRRPKGALIGATKENVIRDPQFWYIGDCAFSAKLESGEGISFAIRDGINVAKQIAKRKQTW